MSMVTVDVGSEDGPHSYAAGITAGAIIENVHGRRIGAVAALIDGVELDLSTEIDDDCTVRPVTSDSDEGLYILRHSCAHLLAQAVTELFPEAKPTIGPPIENGFYYDFHMPPISEEDIRAI